MLSLTQRFNYKGRQVAWDAIGNGPPLVLLHGTPFSSQVWRHIAPLLASRHRVFYFDLLGYGQTEKRPDQNISLAVQNGLLAELIREWGLNEPEILCHDFGGATALRAHYLDRLQYSRLTLVDPVAIAPWGSPFVQHIRIHEAAFAGMPDYAHKALLKAYIQSAAHHPLREKAMEVHLAPWLEEDGKPAFYRQIAQMSQAHTDEVEAQYGPMPFPVRILWGELDEWLPLSQGRKLAERLCADEFIPVGLAGHLVQEDAPAAIIAAMFK